MQLEFTANLRTISLRGYRITLLALVALTWLSYMVCCRAYPVQWTTSPQTQAANSNGGTSHLTIPLDTTRCSDNETQAVALLRDLTAIQSQYIAMFSTTAQPGTWEELMQTSGVGLETWQPLALRGTSPSFYASRNGYFFQIFIQPESADYCVYAWPETLGQTGRSSFLLYQERVFQATAVYSGTDHRPTLEAGFQGAAFAAFDPKKNIKPFNDGNLWKVLSANR